MVSHKCETLTDNIVHNNLSNGTFIIDAPNNDIQLDYTPKPNDIQDIYNYVNKLYEKSLADGKEINNLANIITKITNRVKSIKNKYEEIIPDLCSRILLLETEKEEKSSISKKEKESIHNKINESKTRIQNLNNFAGLIDNIQNNLDSSTINFGDCNEKIQSSQNIIDEIHKNFTNDVKNEIYKGKFKPVNYSKVCFNHDVVLLVDSNLGKMSKILLSNIKSRR